MSQASSACSGTWLWTNSVRDVGVDADGEQQLGQLRGWRPELGRVLGDGQGVQVDDAEERVGLVLVDDPVPQRPEEVAEVDGAGGLDAGEDAGHGGERRGPVGADPT